jgi:hypothetical protein
VANPSQVLRVIAGSTDKEPTAEVVLVTESGAALPGANLPTLPTVNGDYTLRVASGVYTWVLEGT